MTDLYRESERCWLEKFEYYVRRTPEKRAVASREVSLTFRQLYDLAQGFACRLSRQGIVEGDYVLCCASDRVEYVAAYMGTLYCRAVFVPLEKDVQKEKFSSVYGALGGCKVIIGNREHAREGSTLILTEEIFSLCGEQPRTPYPVPPRDALSHVLFTTGSTGACKGVVTDNAQFCQSVYFAEILHQDPSSVMYIFFPTNHYAFFAYACATLSVGGAVVLSHGLVGISDFFAALDRYGVNSVFATPSVFNYLLSYGEKKLRPYAPQMKTLAMAGEKCPQELQSRLQNFFPDTEIVLWYGSTEAGSISNYSLKKYGVRENCIGKLNRGVCVDFLPVEGAPDLHRLAAVTPYGMKGYLGEPELTKTILVDGYVYTDDYGYEKDGLYYVLGRIGSVIISGGYKINPGEVEEACLSCKGVAECVCVPLKHEIFGAVPKLVVSVQAGAALSREELTAHLYARLEAHKVPKVIEFTDEIRKNANGKIDRKFYTESAT